MCATPSLLVPMPEKNSTAMDPTMTHLALMGTGMGMMNIRSLGNIMPKASRRP